MQHKLLRPAIAMIELIFSIVVMGIAMLSVPLMLDTATKSNAVAFQQESIAIIAAHANSMLTYAWDENNTQTHAPNAILTVTNGDNELDANRSMATQLRKQKNNYSATLPVSFGPKVDKEYVGTVVHIEAIPDDIDDFHNTDANLSIAKADSQLTTKGDYLDVKIKMHTTINYLADNANYSACSSNTGCAFSKRKNQWISAGGTTNIKLITTTLTSSNVSDKQILLRSFMCNIGAALPNVRSKF